MADDPVAVLRRARQDAINITDKVSGRALYKILKSAEDDLAHRLENHRKMKPMGDGSFTRTQMEVTLRQIREVMRTVIDKLGIVIPDAAVGAAEEASDGVADYLRASEKAFTGINQPLALDEATMSDAAVAGTKASVVRRLMVEHPDGKGGGILQRYGYAVAEKFEKQLRTAVVTRKPFAEVRDAFVEESPFLQQAPQHWAERLTQTELFHAYNKGAHESMKVANAELGDMVRIVVATFDDRTGADSWNVHGEVRGLNEPFEYVDYDGEHTLFLVPPNRPRDREVVVAHRLSWPIPPAFRPKSTGEVEARYKKMKSKYHGRPHIMSTIRELKYG